MTSQHKIEILKLFEPPHLDSMKDDELNPTGFSTEINYYVLPDCEEKVKLNFGVYLMLCGTSTTATIDQWKSWLVTWTCLLTPTVVNELSKTQYQLREISSADLEGLSTKMDVLNSVLQTKETEVVRASAIDVQDFIKLQSIPFPNKNVEITKVKGNFSIRHLYCYYSLMLLLAGKQFEEDSSEILVAHPEALRKQASITETSAFLKGNLRVPDESYIQLNSAWNELEDFKSKVFTEYSNYNSLEANFLQKIIWTTMRKLQDNSVNHALIIYNYLKSNPSAMEDPELRSSILIYRNHFSHIQNFPDCLYPYMKIIYGESLFPQKGAELLYERAKAYQPKNKAGSSSGLIQSHNWY